MKIYIPILLIALISPFGLSSQTQPFSLEDCIVYALGNSTDIERSQNNVLTENANLEQAKASRLPNLQLDLDPRISSSANYDNTTEEWSSGSNSSVNVSLTSQVSLYQGAKIKNTILQNRINLETAELEIKAQEEAISLKILSYYINALLTKENLINSELQLEAIQKELSYTEARNEAGIVPYSDLLYIKSQMASAKTSKVEAESNMHIALVSLMQVMNMPISDNFDIVQPNIDIIISQKAETNPQTVFDAALGIQPSIKTADLSIQSSEFDTKIAKSGYLPSVVLSGGMGSGSASSLSNINFEDQISNNINSYIGIGISVPIYQRKQVKTQVKKAQIQTSNAKLELTDIKNSLRKYIEQACTDAQTAQSNYAALQDQLDAEQESYALSSEMFSQGMVNSVEFLLSKNNLIIAENKLSQAKYNLVLQNKIVEYYLGNPIEL